MTGASEATLQELLQTNQSMAASLARLAGTSASTGGRSSGGGGSSGGSGIAGAGATALGKALTVAGAAIGATTGLIEKGLSPAIKAASAAFVLVSQSANVLYANQLKLAEGAIAGTNSLESLTAGLEQLPGILGLAMKAYNYQIKKMEANIQTYQDISSVGARFGGSLDEVRRSAASTYLSMDEFASVMKEAGPQLRFLGSTTEEGAKNLVKFNTNMIQGSVGKGLLGMGYTLSEANGMLSSYSEAVGGLKASQMKDQKGMEQSVKFFAEELDGAAQLEGKTREQKEKEMKEASQQAAVRAKLSEMGPEEQKKYLAAYNAALRVGGKGAAEALQSQLLGLPPMTKAAQQFVAVNGEGAETVKKLSSTITDGSKAVDARTKIDKLAAQGQAASAKLNKENSVAFAAISMQGGNLADTINQTATNMADMNDMEATSAEDLEKRTAKVREEQIKAQESQIGALVQQQGAAKHAGEMMDLLYSVLQPLIPYILQLNEAFIKILPTVAVFGADVIERGVKFLEGIFAGVDWSKIKESFETTWKILTDTFDGIFNAIGSGGGAGTGQALQHIFTEFMSIIGKIIKIVGEIITRLITGGAFDMLGNLIKSIVDLVFEIVDGPLGKFAIDVVVVTFDILVAAMTGVVDAVRYVIKVLDNVFSMTKEDWAKSFIQVQEWITKIISTVVDWFKSIPAKINELFTGDVLQNIFDAIKSIFGSIFNFYKNIGSSIIGWIKGGGSSSAPAAPTEPTQNSQSTPDHSKLPPMTKEAKEFAASGQKSSSESPNSVAELAQTATVAPASTSGDINEMLRAELQRLNSINTQLLKAMRDTSDNTKSTANILASNGNLLKRA